MNRPDKHITVSPDSKGSDRVWSLCKCRECAFMEVLIRDRDLRRGFNVMRFPKRQRLGP